jgi:hypothetical protein
VDFWTGLVQKKDTKGPVVSFSVGLGVYVPEPLSTYRGRGEIGGVYLPSQLERIHYNFVSDGSYI